MHYYLGVDIGTTATKAVAFSTAGDVLASESTHYAMQHPQPGWSEQDPDEILHAVISSVNKVVATLQPQAPAFIAFSAAMHSVLAVDDKGHPLTPSIIWADNRSSPIAEALCPTEQGQRFYQATGVPIHSMSPQCKLVWLKQHQPVVFTSAFKFIGIKEYVFFHCFGKYWVDTSIASATGLLNLESLEWEESILHYIGISPDRLSRVVPTKQVLYYEGSHPQLSIPLHTPIVIGGSDGALSNLGAVGKDLQAMVVTIGTSGAVRLIVNQLKPDPQMRTFCYHVKDSYYITGGATNNGAVVLQWLKETLLETEESYEALLDLAKGVAPGSDGLLFMPYLLGERAPIWNAQAKGVFFGLGVQHSKAHMVRAAMEGVIYCLYSIGSILLKEKDTSELYASGGFARSPLWLQLLADVFNKNVLVSAAVESAALGAVILGAEALGMEYNEEKSVDAVYKPNPAHHEVYRKGFEQFQRLYKLLEGEMK
jgi:gluconokinase